MSEYNQYTKPAMNDDLMRSFGRVRGRKLGQEQSFLIENILPQIAINLEKEIDCSAPKICLEIGFGRGEHLAQFAKANPDISCIGCEPFINGVARLVKYIHEDKIPNIRILHGDARLLLEKLPANILDRAFILFPDPWPKAKHQRKRIVSRATLDALQRVMKKGAILEVATDHVDYGQWIAQHLSQHMGFNQLSDGTIPPADWIRTKYQEKAEKQGRGARFFKFSSCN
ncbi:MAG: tRNA ((46)-N7)-methyltransferase TrmB [Rickettsiaceae bacterium]|jgi:tRNA (guanine-N7-)-methyltransferase|nr:tRNA ((46)-N7)-methyltransferase TrmB [Rickettsiaceae bacterium]